jgi:hypothetical protein
MTVAGFPRGADLSHARRVQQRATGRAAAGGLAGPLRAATAAVGSDASVKQRALRHGAGIQPGRAGPSALSGRQHAACDRHDLRLGATHFLMKCRLGGGAAGPSHFRKSSTPFAVTYEAATCHRPC